MPRARRRPRCSRSACIAGWSGAPAAPPRWRVFSTMRLGHDKVWIATRLDIARHWIAKHPPPGGWKPSQLTRTLFVERFGGIYEHSRWVAEAAYDAGLTSADDSAEGLACAMAAAMAGGSDAAKRALIQAHPDLAGRLALAKQLTKGIHARTGERRPRPSERGRTRALHCAQRGLSRAIRLSLRHGGEGQDQGRDFGGVRAAARERRPGGIWRRAARDRADRRASPPGDTALNGASRLLRGRLLEFRRLAAARGGERASTGGGRRRLDREWPDRRRRARRAKSRRRRPPTPRSTITRAN